MTTHWALADEFRAAFPEADLVEHAMYVDDGQILSSGGMLASADLCLYVLGQDHGQSYANDVSRVLISPPHRTGGQAQYAKADPGGPTPLTPVLEWMDRALAEPLTFGEVARPRAHEPADAWLDDSEPRPARAWPAGSRGAGSSGRGRCSRSPSSP